MKRIFFILLVTALSAGCVTQPTTNFKSWQDSKVHRGEGGSVVIADGVEIWEHGSPEKPHKIIGLIEQSHHDSGLLGKAAAENAKKEMIALAKQHGADALIYKSSERSVSGFSSTGHVDTYSTGYQVGVSSRTRARYKKEKVVLLIRYVK